MNFRILELKKISGASPNPTRYRLDARTGFYIKIDDVIEEPKGLYDILLNGGSCLIIKVNIDNNIDYTIGDRVVYNNGQPFTINMFEVIKNRMYVRTSPTNVIDMSSVRKYVEPVITPTSINERLGRYSNFNELERRVVQNRVNLKLGGTYNHNSNMGLLDFVRGFITTYNESFPTLYAETERQQEPSGKRRSLGDMFMICKYYYPECNLFDLIKILYITIPSETNSVVGSLICETIHKRVWWRFGSNRFSHETNRDEYGNTKEYYLTQLRAPIENIANTTNVTNTNQNVRSFDEVKALFPVGTRFRTTITPNTTVTVDSRDFYDGVNTIILIQSNGSRKVVYDKRTNTLARILR